jgi:thiosulfate reductase cytochrome b subunit
VKRHHAVVRITHWVNAIALTIMIGSGLRIFNAYPAFARRGESFCCYPFEHTPIPAKLTFGGWLGGARNWHFAMMWVLVVNGAVYLAFIYLHGEWRDLVPRRGIIRDSREMIKFYLARRQDHPRQGKHNSLQRMAYFAMPLVGIAAVVTGIAIWKPVQLAPLTALLGGYVWARYWHFWTMLLLVLLTIGHVFMVFTVDPYSLPSMFTGNYREDLSPEARNARPFVHLLPGRHSAAPND